MVFREPAVWPDWTTSTGMSGRRDPEHVRKSSEEQQAFVARRVDERHKCARVGRRDNRGPVDRRLERRAHEPDLVAVHVGQELTARERVVDILEVSSCVIAKTSHRERCRHAASPRARHRFENHRVAVAGDELIGLELVHQALEDRQITCGLRRFGRASSL